MQHCEPVRRVAANQIAMRREHRLQSIRLPKYTRLERANLSAHLGQEPRHVRVPVIHPEHDRAHAVRIMRVQQRRCLTRSLAERLQMSGAHGIQERLRLGHAAISASASRT